MDVFFQIERKPEGDELGQKSERQVDETGGHKRVWGGWMLRRRMQGQWQTRSFGATIKWMAILLASISFHLSLFHVAKVQTSGSQWKQTWLVSMYFILCQSLTAGATIHAAFVWLLPLILIDLWPPSMYLWASRPQICIAVCGNSLQTKAFSNSLFWKQRG